MSASRLAKLSFLWLLKLIAVLSYEVTLEVETSVLYRGPLKLTCISPESHPQVRLLAKRGDDPPREYIYYELNKSTDYNIEVDQLEEGGVRVDITIQDVSRHNNTVYTCIQYVSGVEFVSSPPHLLILPRPLTVSVHWGKGSFDSVVRGTAEWSIDRQVEVDGYRFRIKDAHSHNFVTDERLPPHVTSCELTSDNVGNFSKFVVIVEAFQNGIPITTAFKEATFPETVKQPGRIASKLGIRSCEDIIVITAVVLITVLLLLSCLTVCLVCIIKRRRIAQRNLKSRERPTSNGTVHNLRAAYNVNVVIPEGSPKSLCVVKLP